MAFPAEMVTVLTGATPSQLATWRRDPVLLEPEIARRPRALYSFRDVVALRTMVFLRSQVSLQRVRAAFAQLVDMDLTDHPSRYRLTTDGQSVFLIEEDGAITDLVKRPGQQFLATLEQIYAPFHNLNDDLVVDFRHPRRHLEVSEARLGGWPTIRGTRVPFDAVADLMADGDVTAEEVVEYYPTVYPAGAIDAVEFDELVAAAGAV